MNSADVNKELSNLIKNLNNGTANVAVARTVTGICNSMLRNSLGELQYQKAKKGTIKLSYFENAK